MGSNHEGRQLLTNSRRNSFLICARRHYYEYELCRRPVKTPEPLRYGSLVHKMLESHWRGEEIVDLTEAARESDPYEVARAAALVDGYHEHYGTDAQAYKVVAVEQEYVAPLFNPDTRAESRTWLLSGKIDVIVKDADGRLIIVEHKTTSKSILPDGDYWPRLTIDGQIGGYHVGCDALGHKVDHVLYDVIFKLDRKVRYATEVKVNKNGAISKATRLEDETPDAYHDRYLADIRANPDRIYARRELVRLQDEIVDYMSDMWTIGKQIRISQINKYWPRNPTSCDAYGKCPYFDVCCRYASIDDDSRFATTPQHPELGGAA
ncbi:MAG: PD-(D/E)XK nuclease family protein [Chitinispirillia bacterium]|nr:PD-(D/E)XK nuclease family protein [Chitinispirillia bacterium]MCL2241341.1 PD-(D/E)XK nuclease family protein [Chitinispirillia bacterium]